jgi:hypothetical protein
MRCWMGALIQRSELLLRLKGPQFTRPVCPEEVLSEAKCGIEGLVRALGASIRHFVPSLRDRPQHLLSTNGFCAVS